MSRSRKDGRRGGGHGRDGSKGLNQEFAAAKARKCAKKIMTRERRRRSKHIEFEASATHFQTEKFTPLRMPTLDYRVYMAITRALKQSESPEVLLEFLKGIADTSDLLEDRTYIQGLTSLARDHESWIRRPETWCVETGDRGEQFSELARHLFASYDDCPPRFMDRAWLDNNPVHQSWYKHIAGGANIRTAAGLPFVLTRKMAHHFLMAPKDYTVVEALRWGQVYGLGGNRRLVEALRETYLVGTLNRDTASENFWFLEDDFWVSVIRFFIAHPMLDEAEVPLLVDYIRIQKYGDPQRGIEPAHPNFSMKNRTPERLLDQQDAWEEARWEEARRTQREAAARRTQREAADRLRKPEARRWQRSGIAEFRLTVNGRPWYIRELQSTAELKNEGSAMQHCVATYSDSCQKRTKSVWTMEHLTYDADTTLPARNKVLTIAVNLPSKLISEARGKRNRLPTKEEKFILSKWAEQEGMRVSSDILPIADGCPE